MTEASVGESENSVDNRQRDMGAGASVAVQRREKKKDPPSSQPGAQPRQTPGSIHVVTGVGPEPTLLNQEAQPLDVDANISVLDSATGRTTVEVEEATAGVASSSRTQRRTLELVARIGHRPLRVLIDSGSTGNYIDARECAARKIKIQKEDQAEELKMADGSMVKTEGQVHITLKCGGYKDVIAAQVFPKMNKPLILGIPCLSKVNPHVDWAQLVVVVKQNYQWISLALTKSTLRQP